MLHDETQWLSSPDQEEDICLDIVLFSLCVPLRSHVRPLTHTTSLYHTHITHNAHSTRHTGNGPSMYSGHSGNDGDDNDQEWDPCAERSDHNDFTTGGLDFGDQYV